MDETPDLHKYVVAVGKYYSSGTRPYQNLPGYPTFENLIGLSQDQIFQPCTRLVLLGGPGTGKTTSLDMLAYEAVKKHGIIPIFVSLRNYSSSLSDLLDASIARFESNLNFDILSTKTAPNSLLFLFDGFDELTPLFSDKAMREILGIDSKYTDSIIIITSRHGYNTHLLTTRGWQSAEIPLLTNEQIVRFLQEVPDHERLLASIESDKKLMNLARHPLFLITIRNAHKYGVGTRQYLFSEMLRYSTWRDHTKSLIPARIDPKTVESALSALAYKMLMNGDRLIPHEEATKICQEFVANKSDVELLINILLDSGMLIQEHDRLRFFHLTAHETHAALYLKEQIHNPGVNTEIDAKPLFSTILKKPVFREVVRILTALLSTTELSMFFDILGSKLSDTIMEICGDVLLDRMPTDLVIGNQETKNIALAAKAVDSFTSKYASERPDILVFAVHGINTRGTWKNDLGFELTFATDGHRFLYMPWDYGDARLGIIDPFSRRKWVGQFHQFYNNTISRFAVKPQIAVVAHSFGTYIVSKALTRFPGIEFDRILLLSAAMRRDFDWSRVSSRCGRILSIICGEDWPLKIARFLPFIGSAGLDGFDKKFHFLSERIECLSEHSDVFGTPYMRKVWIPFFRDGTCD
ncbi:NACHT domain-containing protein [Fundidesulfovibrio terrae]|uniref:NACHT domain-containing protein n=1 Tax=Fundidesulfovibrio terrae TaxID=2922866 RepID=UPI001FAFECCD|nr:NACHT domain-containing protein [Fundidesulfovibrio terrae]